MLPKLHYGAHGASDDKTRLIYAKSLEIVFLALGLPHYCTPQLVLLGCEPWLAEPYRPNIYIHFKGDSVTTFEQMKQTPGMWISQEACRTHAFWVGLCKAASNSFLILSIPGARVSHPKNPEKNPLSVESTMILTPNAEQIWIHSMWLSYLLWLQAAFRFLSSSLAFRSCSALSLTSKWIERGRNRYL